MIDWVIATALAATSTPAQAEMIRVADAFDRAQIAQDKVALERLTDETLVFIDGRGERLGKKEFIAGWLGPKDRFEPVTLVDRTFTPLGPDAFVASAETTLRGTTSGEPYAVRIRFSDTFRRFGPDWRAVHIHVTRMAQ